MKSFTEWCQEKGFVLEGVTKDPVKSGKKLGCTDKKSPGSRDQRDDLSKDYKGNWKANGTVDPFHAAGGKKSGSGKKVADVAG